MPPLTSLTGNLLLFTFIAATFLLIVLLLGKFVRPTVPDPEKSAIYECGEPTIGSSWVQFDLRFYVVALLFVIFDVEVAFFFPWAVVFGKTIRIADPTHAADPSRAAGAIQQPLSDLGITLRDPDEISRNNPTEPVAVAQSQAAARKLAQIAFVDLLVFFGVVLVGFAYLWKRGDLDWVRATAAQPHGEALLSSSPAAQSLEQAPPSPPQLTSTHSGVFSVDS